MGTGISKAFHKHQIFYDNHNLTGYLIRVLSTGHVRRKQLSSGELDRARRHFLERQSRGIHLDSVSDYPVNLVFLIVESLPYRAVTLNDSILTPTLCNLVNDSSVITLPCKVLTRYGRSSDAQFMYNTGLLPLRTEPLVASYAHNNYPSLAKALGKESLEVIGESSNL